MRRIKVPPGKKIRLPNGKVLDNENELVISTEEFAHLDVAALVEAGSLIDLGGSNPGDPPPLVVPLPSRRKSATYTTPSLAAGASHQGVITLAPGYRVYGITLDRPARVRLYGTVAQQTADLARAATTLPSPQAGVMFDYVGTAGLLDAVFAPPVDGLSLETPPVGGIPVTVTNTDTTAGVVTVTLKYLLTEV